MQGGKCEKDGVRGADDFCSFEKKSILDALLYSYG
jgi:hypothetical protein